MYQKHTRMRVIIWETANKMGIHIDLVHSIVSVNWPCGECLKKIHAEAANFGAETTSSRSLTGHAGLHKWQPPAS